MNTIKTILASVSHNPHYLNKYITFITNCQEKNENYSGYTERHHICPKAKDMFPEFTSFREFSWNCVRLTPRQHYIAHLLLCKTYPDVSSQAIALCLMINSRSITAHSKTYNKLKIEASDFIKGKIYVKDINGKTLRVNLTDSRYISGELIHINKGRLSVRDIYGNTMQVDNTDPRYLSGELVSVAKGKTIVRDSDGNTFQVDTTDPRFLSGELLHVTKGKISEKRTLTTEQVIEIRLALKNPMSVLTNDFLSTMVTYLQRDKVDSIPFEDLRCTMNKPLVYRNLLINYYATTLKVSKSIITNIIDGKTYKEIIA